MQHALIPLIAALLATTALADGAVRERSWDMRRYLLEIHPWLVRDLLTGQRLVLSELTCLFDINDEVSWRNHLLTEWRHQPEPFEFSQALLEKYPDVDWADRRRKCA